MKKLDAKRKLMPILLLLGIIVMLLSLYLLLLAIGYMERGYVGTSLLTLLVGFSLLSSSLYLLRLSTYVYATERKSEKE